MAASTVGPQHTSMDPCPPSAGAYRDGSQRARHAQHVQPTRDARGGSWHLNGFRAPARLDASPTRQIMARGKRQGGPGRPFLTARGNLTSPAPTHHTTLQFNGRLFHLPDIHPRLQLAATQAKGRNTTSCTSPPSARTSGKRHCLAAPPAMSRSALGKRSRDAAEQAGECNPHLRRFHAQALVDQPR